jgi:hypothetical protein
MADRSAAPKDVLMSELQPSRLSLAIVAPETEAYLQALHPHAAGIHRIVFDRWDDLAAQVAGQIARSFPHILLHLTGDAPVTAAAAEVPPGAEPDLCMFFTTDGEALAAQLQELINRRHCRVIAPRTRRHGLNYPLFLISIPKSGTHLLMELARALGYSDGGSFEYQAPPAAWYYLEYSNSHTAAPDFFVDSVRREPFGNRLHPFPSSPALFIYRHPLDILVSEANYYHRPGKTTFTGYLTDLDFEQRLLKLTNDPWILGSIRDRVGRFAGWLDFPNVIPLSFEELIGAAGGGDAVLQRQLVWSLLLKLQLSGDADDIAARVFNPESPTFEKGRIGGHRMQMTSAAWAAVGNLDSDFLKVFGYSVQPDSPLLSSRVAEFIARPLQLPPAANGDTPVLLETEFLAWNLVFLRGLFRAIPVETGPIDLRAFPEEELVRFPAATSLHSLKNLLFQRLAREQAENALAARAQAEADAKPLRRLKHFIRQRLTPVWPLR